MKPALAVLNVREIPEVQAALDALPIDKILIRGYTERQIADSVWTEQVMPEAKARGYTHISLKADPVRNYNSRFEGLDCDTTVLQQIQRQQAEINRGFRTRIELLEDAYEQREALEDKLAARDRQIALLQNHRRLLEDSNRELLARRKWWHWRKMHV